MKIKCTFHIAIAFILIQLTDEFSIAFAYGICEKNPYVRILYVTFAILSLLTMIYLYTKYIIRIQMQDLFLGMPLPKKKWCITAVLMPVLICLFYIFFTKGTFEKGNLTYKEIIDVVTISILSSGIKAAVTEEIVFRGMILRLLQNTFGKKCAVFVSSFLFAVYHFDGIDTSDIKKVIMMIISVEIAGIALALVTEQTGSIWSSVMIHCLYNILSGESQIFHIDVAQNFPAIWMYTVNSKNMLLTGINGSVGFTASIPTMAGFTGIILMVIYDEKRKKHMGKSCSKIILLILILAAWIVVTVRAKKTEEGIILTDAYKKQIMESAEWKKIFLHTENYPDILLEDLKRNPEMLEFVEGYNDVHKKSSEGLTFEERKKKVPLFIQWDKRWGYEPYGTSDIGISGCGPTCMAMVIYSLTRNTEATPPVLAQKSMNEGYYVEGIGTSWKFMREAALDYGVIASQFDMLGEQEMADRLKDGNLIICAMGPGDFTNSGHFIVIYDYSRKKFSVNDPFSYTNSSKKWEYTTLISQCQQIWVYAA